MTRNASLARGGGSCRIRARAVLSILLLVGLPSGRVDRLSILTDSPRPKVMHGSSSASPRR